MKTLNGSALAGSRFLHANSYPPSLENNLAPAGPMRLPAVVRRLGTIFETIVAQHTGDAQPIVAEDTGAALDLGRAVPRLVAPGLHRRLVTPERQRQQLARLDEALESLDRHEAVDFLQIGLQRRGEVEIVLPLTRSRPDLEDHGDHGFTSTACGAEASRRNSLSSRRMNCSLRANS